MLCHRLSSCDFPRLLVRATLESFFFEISEFCPPSPAVDDDDGDDDDDDDGNIDDIGGDDDDDEEDDDDDDDDGDDGDCTVLLASLLWLCRCATSIQLWLSAEPAVAVATAIQN